MFWILHWWCVSNHSLPLLPGSLWIGVVVPVMATSMSQIKLINHLLHIKTFNCVQTNDHCWIISVK